MFETTDARPEWATLMIHWPENAAIHKPRNGDEAHQLAAKATAQANDPRAQVPGWMLTGKSDSNASGLSMIRYSARPSAMRITVVGDEAVDSLEQYGHKLTRALGAFAGTALRETWRRGRLSIGTSPNMCIYTIPHYVFARKPAKNLEYGQSISENTLSPALAQWIATQVEQGIARQAGLLGLEVPEDTLVQVARVDSFGGWRRKNYFCGVVAKNTMITTNLRLDGPWSVGHMCLLGSGYLRRDKGLEMMLRKVA